jgi:ABC-type glutathione transport system ATPase component
VKLSIRALQIAFGTRTVVELSELDVDEHEIVGLVGESGSGKSMTALSVMGLSQQLAGATVNGSIQLDGEELTTLSERRLRRIRGARIAMIFQSPVSAFNPVFRVGDIFVDALRLHGRSKGDARAEAAKALRQVFLAPDLLYRYPHQLSGGQAQRVAIALALALRSEVLLADEPTSALDVTVQAEIVEILRDVREREGMAILFVSHDLGVVAQLCDRVAVLRRGRLIESGPAAKVLHEPQDPYTRELIAAVPKLGTAAA